MKKIYTLIIVLTSILIISCDDTETGIKENCNNKPCLENEECIIENNKAVCQSIDPCLNYPCNTNEECVVRVGAPAYPECTCKEGYQLEGETCEKIPTQCDEITCQENQKCIIQNETPTCICNDGYYKHEETCIFDCRNINGSEVNQTNNGCICNDDNYIIDDNECVIKQGCKLDEANCGEFGNCKEDLEKDWYCECNEGYYFNGTTCIAENKCQETEIECTGAENGCCPFATICLNDNECQLFIQACQDDGDCAENEFCDPISEKCVKMDDVEGCIFKPEYNEQMTPLLSWQWPGEQTIDFPEHKQIYMAPMVANINDDNNDGVVDLKDTPDVVFSTFSIPNTNCDHDATCDGILRVIDGRTGTEIANTSSSDFLRNYPIGEIAIGDIDNDNQNEILVSLESRKIVAYGFNLATNKLEVKWTTTVGTGGQSIAIADLDHDGNPEVITGKHIFNGEDGTTVCTYAQAFGFMPIIEDVNDDNIMDVILGNQIVSGDDCRVLVEDTQKSNKGYTAIADLNNDGIPEVVKISVGYLYIYDKETMIDLIEPLEIDTSFTSSNGTVNLPIGGPPTIGNFDNDSDLEIAVAGQEYYSVIDVDLSNGGVLDFLWRSPNNDRSSRQTGSSLFDFEGDGIAEVLYADECYFRIYNGEDGSERFKIKNSSGTAREYPIVVDVDNDGKSEVIVISNEYGGSQTQCAWEDNIRTFGVRMFEAPDNTWVRTRRIWNQHTYHVTNVNEDGSIPINEEHNWESYNNYRLNVQGKGVFNSPNFVIDRIEVERTDCPMLKFNLKIKLSNKGSLSINAGLPISIYKNINNTKTLITTLNTEEVLFPGSTTYLEYEFIPENPDSSYSLSVIADDKGNGTGEYNECNETDNTQIVNFKGAYTAFCKAGVGECMRFAPYICDQNNELSCGAIAGEPVDELCGDGFDNNCDGNIDEACGCNTETQECYHASSDLLAENSRCQKGIMYCIGGENWGECKDDILPIVELCNAIDDDCDGETDEDFEELGQVCTLGLGICEQSGVFVCDLNGNMICDAIPSQAGIEICNDNLDNNCNGVTDEKPCQE